MSDQSPPAAPSRPPASPWALLIARVAGIPIRLHFTFLLFLVWVGIVGQSRGSLVWPLLMISLFVCVVLHELGHALVARRFGVETRDITLYPIGGVAMLNSRPNARQELWIALAGPAVNLVIAAILYVVVTATEGHGPSLTMVLEGRSFAEALFAANMTLALFNLIPAFPMDGGRVLRSLLAYGMTETRATQLAAAVGQIMAIGFGLWGLFSGQAILMLIAFFVFLGAGQEAQATVTRSFLEGHKVEDAMQTRFRTMTNGASLNEAAEMLLAGSQHDFPVVNGDDLLGVLTREGIARGLADAGPGGYVAAYMHRDIKTASRFLPLERAVDLFNQGDSTPILVMDEGTLVGMVTGENLSEFIMLEHARSRPRG